MLNVITNCTSITEPAQQIPNTQLELYADYEYDDGYYRMEYPSAVESSYGRIHYRTEPITRVFWTSTDSFTFVYWNLDMTYPVADYSTYSDANGEGQKLFYLYPAHIGDTLDIFGCIEDCQQISIIIE